MRSNAMFDAIPVFSPAANGAFVSEIDAQDIDTEEDWRLDELKFQMRLKPS
jgi:hypothetical protein